MCLSNVEPSHFLLHAGVAATPPAILAKLQTKQHLLRASHKQTTRHKAKGPKRTRPRLWATPARKIVKVVDGVEEDGMAITSAEDCDLFIPEWEKLPMSAW